MNFPCVSLGIFHLWGDLVFIMDDHENFSNWIMILNSFNILGPTYFSSTSNLTKAEA